MKDKTILEVFEELALLVAAHQQGVEAVEAARAEALQAGLRSADGRPRRSSTG